MSASSTEPTGKRPKSESRLTPILISAVAVVVIWELLGRHVIHNDLIFAPLSEVLLRIYEMAKTGELWRHLKASGHAFILGYALAVVLGVTLGILVGLSKTFARYLEPWLIAFYATPMIALAPIFIVILGIGIYSKLCIIFLEAFFPITVNTALGIRSTDRGLIEASRAFGATRLQIIRTILLPYAFPFILAGMRIAVARALAGVLVSEIFGSVSGIGNMIWFSAEAYDMPKLFAGVLILAGTSIVLMSALARLERLVAPWRD